MIIIDKKEYVASLDVHAQYTFTPECPNELPVPDGTAIVPELNAQALHAAYRIGSKEAHNSKAIWIATKEHPQLTPLQGENVDVRWKPHSITGTKGFELIQGLPEISAYDYFVWEGIELDMHPYGVCYHDQTEKLSTGVIEFLHAKKVNTVIIGGLATDYCVKVTTLQLLKANLKVVVNLGACRGMNSKTVNEAKELMYLKGAVLVNSAREISNKK
jgi:nicotinamidase/pyrazinamidase